MTINPSISGVISPAAPPLRLSVSEKTLADLRSRVDSRDRAQIKQSAEDFESLFLGIVLKSMRDTVQKSGLLDGGNAEDIYRSMLDDEYTKSMAAQRHTGLADNIEQFLLSAVASTTGPKNGQMGPPAANAVSGSLAKAQGIKAYQAETQGGAAAAPLRNPEKPARMKDGPAPAPGKPGVSASPPAASSPALHRPR
jgi:flagellar protein FlgJ